MISFVCQMSFEKTCEWCGKQFQTKRYPTKFCSQSCYFKNRAAAKNQRKIQLIKQYDSSLDVVCEGSRMFYRKICDHCGKEFLAPRSNGRFCCTKCHDFPDTFVNQNFWSPAFQTCQNILQSYHLHVIAFIACRLMHWRSGYEILLWKSFPHLDKDSGLSDDYELLGFALPAVVRYSGS